MPHHTTQGQQRRAVLQLGALARAMCANAAPAQTWPS